MANEERPQLPTRLLLPRVALAGLGSAGDVSRFWVIGQGLACLSD